MRIHQAFKHTVAQSPEWKAWERQCDIDQTYNVAHALSSNELTPAQLADFLQYAARQRGIALLLECEKFLDIDYREMNSVVNSLNL